MVKKDTKTKYTRKQFFYIGKWFENKNLLEYTNYELVDKEFTNLSNHEIRAIENMIRNRDDNKFFILKFVSLE